MFIIFVFISIDLSLEGFVVVGISVYVNGMKR